MMVSRVISDSGLKICESGAAIDIRLPWYRSLPLSTVEIGEVRIDGQLVSPLAMTFEVNNKRYALDQLADKCDEWWYVLDSGLIHIINLKLERGSQHEVSVTVGIRPPYIPGFYRLTECTKQLNAE